MLTIDVKPKFWATVTVRLPDQPEQDFQAGFYVIGLQRQKELKVETGDGLKAFLEEALFGTDDIVDAKGEVAPFTDALRDRLIDNLIYRIALWEAYNRAIVEAARGN